MKYDGEEKAVKAGQHGAFIHCSVFLCLRKQKLTTTTKEQEHQQKNSSSAPTLPTAFSGLLCNSASRRSSPYNPFLFLHPPLCCHSGQFPSLQSSGISVKVPLISILPYMVVNSFFTLLDFQQYLIPQVTFSFLEYFLVLADVNSHLLFLYLLDCSSTS